MGVRKKGRRKIVCDGQTYLWCVGPDDDSPYLFLTILSEGKQLILVCPLGIDSPYVISQGRVFQNHGTNGRWNRYLLPFALPEIITPQFVSELISWAAKGSDAIAVEWNGKDIVI